MIMEPNLAIKYPDFTTFRGQSLEGNKTLIMDVTHKGLHAVIKSDSGSIWIDPVNRETNKLHMSYYKNELQNRTTNWQCGVKDHELDISETNIQNSKARAVQGGTLPVNELTLKTYRIAVAATGEYTQFHGGTVKDGMAAIVTAMNRVNGIYETEVGIRMTLVANNDQVIFTDSVTDGYTNDNGGIMLGQNRSKLNSVIGFANYDIGHVFSTGGGGIAGFGVSCGTFKAEGVTGLGSPVNDPFYVDYVAHEIGHQWRGSHIFNAVSNACGGGNRSGSAAVEPGSGSTIMGYAGICGGLNNMQNFSDPYFNSYSLGQIINFSSVASGSSCSVETNTLNEAPIVEAGPNYAIPKSTPFTLCAQATDDNDTNLTFSWEQNDTGPAGNYNTPSGNAPIFRSFNAVTDNCRTFPRLPSVLAGQVSKGETLPTYARNMNFRATVRDNELLGSIGTDDMDIEVTADGPFQLTSFNSIGGTIVSDAPNRITWDVANTDQSPVNCTTVDFDISLDGGVTFENTTSGLPNTGSGTIMVPESNTDETRIRISCSDNIFFDVNNQDMTHIDDLIFNNGFESN